MQRNKENVRKWSLISGRGGSHKKGKAGSNRTSNGGLEVVKHALTLGEVLLRRTRDGVLKNLWPLTGKKEKGGMMISHKNGKKERGDQTAGKNDC